MTEERAMRVVFQLPPGASVYWHEDDAPNGVMALPLWLVWSRLASHHAGAAEAARVTDQYVDATSLALQNPASSIDDDLAESEPRPGEGTLEFDAALISVVASALAIDGLYGAVKPLVNPPRSTANRQRQIVKTLKLGFSVGRESHRWLKELDWLFQTRDVAVHHAEQHRPMRVLRVTQETVVVSSSEAWLFSAPNAHRAADLCTEIIGTCLTKPKPATRDWAKQRGQDGMARLELQATEDD